MPRRTTRVPVQPLTRAECAEAGILARLLNEDWSAMTAKANASQNHVSSNDRWTRKAREANPALDDDQAYRLGQKLKKAHYVRMGQISGQVRRLAREAQAAIESVPADEVA